ncbi:MAG: phosphoribosylanthranilate isomerase [Bradyrhizobium sp.]|uniref:phosphoribosylanthranilate isomerase n=1 Tax=Bradyrhizobium sp. TaxID=376 RepID=UPI0025BFD830|nr:phosphoribosylanthranilate isomerase [Bradyrhizobium sp.]MBI5263257.1 phosphoribosylanthranilate isomerase [Bradyrhizobium sp.]
MLTQIYEISTPDEARAVSEIGIDHVGVLVGDGEFPREQPLARAAEIAAAMIAPGKFSALFLTERAEAIVAWARTLKPAIVHLGAAPELLGPAEFAMIRAALPGSLMMRSVPVYGEESVRIAQSYEGLADYLLLDSHRPSDRQIGALGVPHDWSISRRIVGSVTTPVILAGGLGPDNVAQAISVVRPAGVDSKTKTDREGSHNKDLERVRRFNEAARAAARWLDFPG